VTFSPSPKSLGGFFFFFFLRGDAAYCANAPASSFLWNLLRVFACPGEDFFVAQGLLSEAPPCQTFVPASFFFGNDFPKKVSGALLSSSGLKRERHFDPVVDVDPPTGQGICFFL